MKNVLLLLLHLLRAAAKLRGLAGLKRIVARNLLLKQQLLVVRRLRLLLHEMLAGEHHEAIAEQVSGDNFRRLVTNLRGAQQQGDIRPGVDPAALAFMPVAASASFYQSRPVLRQTSKAKFADQPHHYAQQVTDLTTFVLRPTEEGS